MVEQTLGIDMSHISSSRSTSSLGKLIAINFEYNLEFEQKSRYMNIWETIRQTININIHYITPAVSIVKVHTISTLHRIRKSIVELKHLQRNIQCSIWSGKLIKSVWQDFVLQKVFILWDQHLRLFLFSFNLQKY